MNKLLGQVHKHTERAVKATREGIKEASKRSKRFVRTMHTVPVVHMVERRYAPLAMHFGEPHAICHEILQRNWNEDAGHFYTSAGNGKELLVRDFCFVVPDLLELGYSREVLLTLEYMLSLFEHNDGFYEGISNDKPIARGFSVDSFPLMMKALLGCREFFSGEERGVVEGILGRHQKFIEHYMYVYAAHVFDYQVGMVKSDVTLTDIRYLYNRKSSTYANCMVGMLSLTLNAMSMKNPFHDIPIGKHIHNARYLGSHFKEDGRSHHHVSVDANIFPFLTGLITSQDMMRTCLATIQRIQLDRPFPIGFSTKDNTVGMKKRGVLFPQLHTVARDTGLGLQYIELLASIDPGHAKDLLARFVNVVKQHRNVYTAYGLDGKPYATSVFLTQQHSIYAAKLMVLGVALGLFS